MDKEESSSLPSSRLAMTRNDSLANIARAGIGGDRIGF